ncbi:MAG: HAD family hydrolase [Mariprofundaceae bacterium]|nr:HAD family hydrolase [Mariprofundaceae bacterium]
MNQQQGIRGVLFDMDGTLVDAFPPIINALNRTLAEYGMATMTPEAIKRHTGRGDCGMKSLFGEHKEKAATRFLELHDADYLKQIKTIEGAEPLLSWLRSKGVPVAIVTSKGQYRAEAQIELLGWQDYFRTIVGKMDGRAEKPSPEPVLMACETLALNPAESIMIGDGIADMKAGSRAGALTAGIVDSFSRKELEESGASICFNSLIDVHEWLKKMLV